MGAADHHRKLERAYRAAPINRFYRPRLTVGDGVARLEVDVREEFLHAAGSVHGSVLFKLLDDAAFFAANSLVEDVFLLTASFSLHYFRPVDSGTIVAEGRVLNVSRRVLHAESEVRDAEGRLSARGTGSFMRSDVRLDAGVGYE